MKLKLPCCQFTLFKFDYKSFSVLLLTIVFWAVTLQSNFALWKISKARPLTNDRSREESETDVLKFGLAVWMYKKVVTTRNAVWRLFEGTYIASIEFHFWLFWSSSFLAFKFNVTKTFQRLLRFRVFSD